MNSKSNQSRDFYFENDIGMAATALMEMFGDGVEERVSERLSQCFAARRTALRWLPLAAQKSMFSGTS